VEELWKGALDDPGKAWWVPLLSPKKGVISFKAEGHTGTAARVTEQGLLPLCDTETSPARREDIPASSCQAYLQN